MDGEPSWAEGFSGKPFEALGTVLDSIYQPGADKLIGQLPEFIEEGMPIAGFKQEKAGIIVYPKTGAIRMGVLVAPSPENDALAVISLYPVPEGMQNTLGIINFKAWENGYEGMIATSTGNFGSVDFFDPFYFLDSGKLNKRTIRKFSLAAIAIEEVGKASVETYQIDKGPLYETSLKDFLEENPDKTKEDFEAPTVEFGCAHVLLATEYTGEYHFRALALAREELTLLDEKIYRYHLAFGDEDDENLEMWLYVSPHIVKGSLPQTGDYMDGFLWLAGHLPENDPYEK